ncbi:MAG: TetR/AcrR family transcriptional regulator [Pikeienuella sp.]
MIPQPRKPERANGVARYRKLISAVEELIESGGTSAVTIQAVAKQAGVPMPSVYHFFPSPVAACIAAAESHQLAISEIVSRPQSRKEAPDPETYIRNIEDEVVGYYNSQPIARRLILGSDCSWHIRQIDIKNQREIAHKLMEELSERFGLPVSPAFENALTNASAIMDAMWALSIDMYETITPHYAEEAHRAAFAYVSNYMD